MPFPMGRAGGVGAGGGVIGLVVALLYAFGVLGGGGGSLGVDPGIVALPGSPAATQPFQPKTDLEQFVGFVVDDVQDTWVGIFRTSGEPYERTKLVLFDGSTQSGCGPASEATGPFYCPSDRKVYLDLGFFKELRRRFGAPGDFAQAYVIAHEFGHHVQNLLGINEQVQRASQDDPSKANEYSIRLELQADCFAGVWAHSAYQQKLLEQGDIQEGMGAAAAVGDDRIQKETQGRVNPETWTHGSSDQRVSWFRTGYESGDPNACDTFSGSVRESS
jgi:predicted metalloprotease